MTRRSLQVLAALLATGALLGVPAPGRAACHEIPRTSYSPTGIAGCTVYGVGLASTWAGPGAARNDCVWPWQRCQPVSVHSILTGRTIRVQPAMFCDCYTGTRHQRLIDLDPDQLAALGLDPADGLYAVEVRPVGALPDTALRR